MICADRRELVQLIQGVCALLHNTVMETSSYCDDIDHLPAVLVLLLDKQAAE